AEDDPASGKPTARQLRRHFVQSMVPMVGFGFMDNTVMIHAGNAIDLTLGVTLGLSTLAAAACGQICSDVAGVTFGGAIESAAMKLGSGPRCRPGPAPPWATSSQPGAPGRSASLWTRLPSPGFTEEQRRESIVKRLHILGSVVGVICGCSLGLVNLLLIDASEAKDRSSSPPPAPTAAIHRRDNQPGARRLHGHHYRGAGHEGPHGLRGHGPEQRELHARGARA
ncbi:unnamed protein product, partial [Prorocentrum cordatum]